MLTFGIPVSSHDHITIDFRVAGMLLNGAVVDELVSLTVDICTARLSCSGRVVMHQAPHVRLLGHLEEAILDDPVHPQQVDQQECQRARPPRREPKKDGPGRGRVAPATGDGVEDGDVRWEEMVRI